MKKVSALPQSASTQRVDGTNVPEQQDVEVGDVVLSHQPLGQLVFLQHATQGFKGFGVTLGALHLDGFVEELALLKQADDQVKQINVGRLDRRLVFAECRHHDILKEGTHGHFLFRRVVEDPETDLVAEPLIGQQVG